MSANSFAGHYGQLIISEGVAPVPRALFLYQGALGLSPQQVWLVSCVLAHKWDGDLPHPSLQEIAQQATLGLRQVKKIKSSLVLAGLLDVRARYGMDGEQNANSYDFGPLFEKLEHYILLDPAVPVSPVDELAIVPIDPSLVTPGKSDRCNPITSSGAQAGAQAESQGKLHTGTLRPERAPDKTTARTNPPTDYSFAARFGRLLLGRGIAAVPRALFTCQAELGLSPQQVWFIIYILSYQWSTELPYPSLRKMASNTGYSERQIHRIKDSLVERGYMRVIERRAADGADTSSAYDFTALLRELNNLIRTRKSGAASQSGNRQAKQMIEESEEGAEEEAAPGDELETTSNSLSIQPSNPPSDGGELCVSGGVNTASGRGEHSVSGGVNCVSVAGVNCVSVAGVNCTSYELESIKEEADKEEPHQQQQRHSNDKEKEDEEEHREQAYYALVDVGVIPSTAFDLAGRAEPELILDWVRYYLSTLSAQSNLSNPLGVLVSRLRSGEEPPYAPSPGDLQSLRLKLSRYR
jgi:hypothetical protein